MRNGVGPRKEVPDEVLNEINKFKTEQVRHLYRVGVKAIDRVMGTDSELYDLWEETGRNEIETGL